MCILTWLIMGALSAGLGIWLVSIKENNNVIDISPLNVLLMVVGALLGWFTVFLAVVILVAFAMTHEPLIEWFKTPFKSIKLSKEKDDE